MPAAIPYNEAIGARIIARHAAGESLKLICGAAGHVSFDIVKRWRRDVPHFARRLARAQEAFRAHCLSRRRPRTPTPDLIAEICARIESGEALQRMCQTHRHLPLYQFARAWLDDHPEFARRFEAAMARKKAQRRYSPRRYSEAVAAAICARLERGETFKSICRDPNMPGHVSVWRWRRAIPAFDRRCREALRDLPPPTGRPSSYSLALERAICARLEAGQSLRSICRSPDMPDMSTVLGWLRSKPGFPKRYAAARELTQEAWTDQLLAALNAADAGGGVAELRAAMRAPKPPRAVKYLP